jgi:outer membrane protein assembly factor BamA
MALAVTLYLTMFVGAGLAQELSTDGCPTLAPKTEPGPGARSHVRWVKDAHGEAKAVRSQVREMRVARLDFAGQTALSESQQEQIAESLTERGYDDDKEGLNDLRWRVVDAWQQQGYFKARVDLSDAQATEDSSNRRTIAITATIQAGKQYRLDEIRFGDLASGAAPTSSAAVVTEGARFSAAELRAFFRIQQGDVFDTQKIREGLEQLRKAYAAKGFVNMTAVPSTQIDDKTAGVALLVEISEGRQFRIGNVEIVGFDTPAIHTFLLEFGIAPGVVFDSSQLDGLNEDIQSILPGRFNLEDDLKRRLDEDRGTVDLIFNIRACPAP